MKRQLDFTLNGAPRALTTDDERLLLWVLRTDLALTGTKYGCGAGICGACTVLVGGKAMRSCKTSLKLIAGKHLVTIEGLAASHPTAQGLHPLQRAFIEHGAFQCGYCTSCMLLAAAALLESDPNPSRAAIADHMAHNLCRCGAHERIVDAVESVARLARKTA